jgi:hypothetical protein
MIDSVDDQHDASRSSGAWITFCSSGCFAVASPLTNRVKVLGRSLESHAERNDVASHPELKSGEARVIEKLADQIRAHHFDRDALLNVGIARLKEEVMPRHDEAVLAEVGSNCL